jgi:hypothetical protein
MERKNIYGFWVSPDGDIYIVEEEYGHRKFLEQLLEEKVESSELATIKQLDKGWVRAVNMGGSLMIDYKYVATRKQFYSIMKLNDILQDNGYFHNKYIISTPHSYKFFDSFKEIIRFIRERL